MAKADIWMPFFVGDYLADTQRLTTEQHGAYLLLILDYWKNGPLPDNPAVLASVARLSPDAWSMHQAMLSRFFSIANGEWRHKRIDAERDRAITNKSRFSARASAAANARWHPTSNASSMPQAMPHECTSPSSSEVKEKPSVSTKNRGKRLPENWWPTEAGLAFAKQAGLSDADIEETRATFCDYWAAQPGQRGVKLDWEATWRNWIRNDGKRANGKRQDFVSESGFKYRGTLEEVIKVASRRRDYATEAKAKRALLERGRQNREARGIGDIAKQIVGAN